METTKSGHERDLGFSTTINLNPDDNERFQLVYVTQLYETFFVLYARFEVPEITEDGPRIEGIEFLGVNYKGPINLKIEDIRVKVDKLTNPEGDESDALDVLMMDLVLSGTGEGTFTRPDEKKKIKPVDLVVPQNSSFRLERKLRSMSDFESRGKIDLPDDAFWNSTFDSEFFIRDGFLITPKNGGVLFEFDENTDIQDHVNGGMIKPQSLPFATGINCPIGVAKINPGS